MSDGTMPNIDDIQFNEINAGTIYSTIIGNLESACSELLYPGDERRIFGEAVVDIFVAFYNVMNDVAKQKMLRFARGPALDALGERTKTPRLMANKSIMAIKFSVSKPLSNNIIIPKGTRVTPDGNIYFATDNSAVLQAGFYSVEVPASSISGGSAYNGFAPGTITTLVDLIPYIDSVTNITETSGGDDGEPYTVDGDNHYRERIRLSPAKFSTAGPVGAYEYYALSADPDIISAKAISPEPGVVTIVVLMKGGNLPDEKILKKVLDAVSPDDVRPLTDYVTAEMPEQVLYDIDLCYYTTAINEAAVIDVVEGENGAIARYNKWQTEALGQDINPDELKKLILCPHWDEGLTGAVRVEIVSPVFTEVSKLSVAKFSGSINVTHQIMG